MPDPTAQHLRPVLDIWAGNNAICLGYVGGATREIVAEFATLDEAWIARQAARDAIATQAGVS